MDGSHAHEDQSEACHCFGADMRIKEITHMSKQSLHNMQIICARTSFLAYPSPKLIALHFKLTLEKNKGL